MNIQSNVKVAIIVLVVAFGFGGLFVWRNMADSGQVSNILRDQAITVYRSATCGCCKNYIAYLKQRGLRVAEEVVNDIQAIKDRYSIPADMASCHTAVMGKYVIEGHVPTEVIEKLVAGQPDISGIALPEMPAGSPGMPGAKQGSWSIYALGTDESTVFTTY